MVLQKVFLILADISNMFFTFFNCLRPVEKYPDILIAGATTENRALAQT